MGEASLRKTGDGEVCLSGALDFSTVPVLWRELEGLIGQQARLDISLREATSSNSAGLTLLLEAKQKAAAAAHELHLRDVPDDLAALAGLSNLESVLDLASGAPNTAN